MSDNIHHSTHSQQQSSNSSEYLEQNQQQPAFSSLQFYDPAIMNLNPNDGNGLLFNFDTPSSSNLLHTNVNTNANTGITSNGTTSGLLNSNSNSHRNKTGNDNSESNILSDVNVNANNSSSDPLFASFDFGVVPSFGVLPLPDASASVPVVSLGRALPQPQQQQQKIGMKVGFDVFNSNSNGNMNNMLYGIDGTLKNGGYTQHAQPQQQQHATLLPLPTNTKLVPHTMFASSGLPLVSQQQHQRGRKSLQIIQPAPIPSSLMNTNHLMKSSSHSGNTSSGATTMTTSSSSMTSASVTTSIAAGLSEAPIVLPPGASAKEKAAFHRERNRQHARSTRARKKAYVNKLKELVEHLHMERTEETQKRRMAAASLAETNNARKHAVVKFLELHSSQYNIAQPTAGAASPSTPALECHTIIMNDLRTIMEDQCYLRQPITPYRWFNRQEICGENRISRGIESIVADCASMSVLIANIGSRSSRWAKLRRFEFLSGLNKNPSRLPKTIQHAVQPGVLSIKPDRPTSDHVSSNPNAKSATNLQSNSSVVNSTNASTSTTTTSAVAVGKNESRKDSKYDSFRSQHAVSSLSSNSGLCTLGESSNSNSDNDNGVKTVSGTLMHSSESASSDCSGNGDVDTTTKQVTNTNDANPGASSNPQSQTQLGGEEVGLHDYHAQPLPDPLLSSGDDDEAGGALDDTDATGPDPCPSMIIVQQTAGEAAANAAVTAVSSQNQRTQSHIQDRNDSSGGICRKYAPLIPIPPFVGVGKRSNAQVDPGSGSSSSAGIASSATQSGEFKKAKHTNNSAHFTNNLVNILNKTEKATRGPSSKTIASYSVNQDEMLLSDDTLMSPFTFRTINGIEQGAIAEVFQPGMIRCTFGPKGSSKLLSVEMVFDSMGFMQQLERANGAGIITSSLGENRSNQATVENNNLAASSHNTRNNRQEQPHSNAQIPQQVSTPTTVIPIEAALGDDASSNISSTSQQSIPSSNATNSTPRNDNPAPTGSLIVPNGLEMALQPCSIFEPRVITLAYPPYSIVSVNEGFVRLTKFTQLDAEGKTIDDLLLSQGVGKAMGVMSNDRQSSLSSSSSNSNPIRLASTLVPHLPTHTTLLHTTKTNQQLVNFICSYPLTNAKNQVTHLFHTFHELCNRNSVLDQVYHWNNSSNQNGSSDGYSG